MYVKFNGYYVGGVEECVETHFYDCEVSWGAVVDDQLKWWAYNSWSNKLNKHPDLTRWRHVSCGQRFGRLDTPAGKKTNQATDHFDSRQPICQRGEETIDCVKLDQNYPCFI